MKKILESNFWCGGVLVLIVIIFSVLFVIQKSELNKLERQLTVVYNYLQDAIDQMMSDEKITSFKNSQWKKTFWDLKSDKISVQESAKKYNMLSEKYFDASSVVVGNVVRMYIKKHNIILFSKYKDNTGDIILKTDINGYNPPDADFIDKFVFRISNDGTLIPCDEKMPTRQIEHLQYLIKQRKKNGNK